MTSASIAGYGTTMNSTGNKSASSNNRRSRSFDHDRRRNEEDDLVESPRTNDTFLVGISLLLLVVFLWTFSNFLTNYQLTKGYDKPFAVTYLNTASFSLYLIPFTFVLQQRRKSRSEIVPEAYQLKGVWAKAGFVLPTGSLWSSKHVPVRDQEEEEEEEEIIDDRRTRQRSLDIERRRLMRPSSIDGRRPLSQQALKAPSSLRNQSPPLDLHQTARLALHFMIVWFMANYCLNLALKLTSVASATTLSSASGFFTLALGAMIGVEVFSFAKLGAVTMSFMGVLMVMRADVNMQDGDRSRIPGEGNPSKEAAMPFAGDSLALASALFYAVYVILLKFRIGREERISMPLFFGFVGIMSITLMWPIGLILHFTGFESLQLPSGKIEWASVLVNMAITVISDFAYLLAMLKSSPLVATVGLSLTIPLAIIGDTLLGSHSGGTQAYIGSAVVLSSFVVIGLVDRTLAKRQQQQQQR